MKIKSFFIGLLFFILSFPVNAEPDLEGHRKLWNTIKSLGIDVYVNDPKCFIDGERIIHGRYSHQYKKLYVCQEDGSDGKNHSWSLDDYDTLRHEGHHIVQDCSVGDIGDGSASTIFDNKSLGEFIKKSKIPSETLMKIILSYISRGAPNSVTMMELEAYATAYTIPPEDIANKIIEFCKNKKMSK